MIISAPAERNFLKAIAVGLLHCHMAIKNKKKTVLHLNGFTRDSLKEIEDKVTNTHTEGKQ